MPVPRACQPLQGWTLIDAAIVLVVLSLLTAGALPSWRELLAQSRVRAASHQLRNDLHFARSMALAGQQQLLFELQRVDDERSCYVLHDGGPGDCRCAVTGAVQCAGGSRSLRHVAFDHQTDRLRVTPLQRVLRFQPVRGTVTPTATIEVSHDQGPKARAIIGILGRVRQCSPNRLPGLPPCARARPWSRTVRRRRSPVGLGRRTASSPPRNDAQPEIMRSMSARQPSIRSRAPGATAGFTIIELMIVVAVLAVLATLAWPSYLDSVRKARRSDAMAALSHATQAQERMRSQNPTYATTLAELGLTSASPDGHYDVSLQAADSAQCGALGVGSPGWSNSYVLKATPRSGGKQAGDSRCTAFVVEVCGGNVVQRSESSDGVNAGSPDPCWVK